MAFGAAASIGHGGHGRQDYQGRKKSPATLHLHYIKGEYTRKIQNVPLLFFFGFFFSSFFCFREKVHTSTKLNNKFTNFLSASLFFLLYLTYYVGTCWHVKCLCVVYNSFIAMLLWRHWQIEEDKKPEEEVAQEYKNRFIQLMLRVISYISGLFNRVEWVWSLLPNKQKIKCEKRKGE